MTVAEIVDRYGPWRIAALAVCLLTWLLLAALRTPFVVVARLLAAAQRGIDERVTDRLSVSVSPGGVHHV